MPKNVNIKDNINIKDSSESEIFENIRKKYGRECVMTLDKSPDMKVTKYSTGLLSIDKILSGGFPAGKIIEIYGAEGSGKTTLALHVIAEIQKAGGKALFIDVEHALNPEYVKKIGVDTSKLIFSQPNSGEEALDIVFQLCGKFNIIVVDSVAALVPKSELEGELFDNKIASQARLMAVGLRNISNKCNSKSALIVFINQLRTSSIASYCGPSETTTGGRSLRYFSSIRLEVKRGEQIKGDDGNVIGAKLLVTAKKNRVAPPYHQCSVDLIYGVGLDKNGDILDMAVKYNLIKKSGSWYEYQNKKICQGRENAIIFLKNNPTISSNLYNVLHKEILKNNTSTEGNNNNVIPGKN